MYLKLEGTFEYCQGSLVFDWTFLVAEKRLLSY